MATRRYMVNVGENAYQVTEAVGLATVSKNIELTVDFDAAIPGNPGAKPTREDVLVALEEFRDYVLRGNWPPA